MRTQQILKVCDLRGIQHRVTILCACGHWSTIHEVTIVSQFSPRQLGELRPGASFPCVYCPDPEPEPVREVRTAIQLWKEAGQP
jgi:hypothetical protein